MPYRSTGEGKPHHREWRTFIVNQTPAYQLDPDISDFDTKHPVEIDPSWQYVASHPCENGTLIVVCRDAWWENEN